MIALITLKDPGEYAVLHAKFHTPGMCVEISIHDDKGVFQGTGIAVACHPERRGFSVNLAAKGE